MTTLPLPLDTDHTEHHSGGHHPYANSAVHGAGSATGRDSVNLVFRFLEHNLGVTVMVAIIAAIGAVFLVRWLLKRFATAR